MDIIKKQRSYLPKLISPRFPIFSRLDKTIVLGSWEFSLRRTIPPFVIIVFFISLAIYAFAFGRGSQAVDQKAALEKETEMLTSKISRFMELPEEEQPTLATVTDRSKLKDKNFFSNAENGDKVLIYAKSKKALLYRPSTGKLIDVAHLASGSEKGKKEEAEEEVSGEEETIEYVE